MRNDNRRAVRRPLQHCEAVIATLSGKLVSKCTVHDISARGARVALANPAAAPDEFFLVLSRNKAVRRRCRTMWRSASEIGVWFPGNEEPAMRAPAPASSTADGSAA